MNTNFKRFDSPEEYADYLSAIPSYLVPTYSQSFGGDSFSSGLATLRGGDTSRLAQAQEIMSKLDVDHPMSLNIRVLEACVAGFVPNVPAAISGHPQSMFRRGFVESPSVNSPLSVHVETTVSAGLSQDQLISRGVCILAFVLAMEMIRPVDLYIANHHSHSKKPGVYGYLVKIASRPMDMGRAVWMLTNPTMARRLFHTTINDLSGAKQQCGHGPWSWDLSPSSEKYQRRTREFFQLQPEDVFMYGGHITDNLMLTDPVAWVKQMIEKHNGTTQDV
jgi:hypothetical protein